MNHIRVVILAIIGTVVLFGFGLAVYLGAFKPVYLNEGHHESMQVIYSRHNGAYHKIVEKLQRIENWAAERDIDCLHTFGEYLDDPKTVVEGRLRSLVGCIVDHKPDNLPAWIKFKEIPRRYYVTAEFHGAPSIGPMKVYPKLMEKIKDKNYKIAGPFFEIYTIGEGNRITTDYLIPVQGRYPDSHQ